MQNKNAEDSVPDSEAEIMEEFWRRPSTVPEVGIDLRYFATEDQARAVGEVIQSWLQVFGRMLNLKRLLRVIVS